jgi:succinate dehydrogenase / fumarate reductase cytochrome b subunit
VATSLGSMIIIIYLLSIGLGEDTFKLTISLSDNVFIRTLLIGLSFCIFFYIASSIRHLLWDYGDGLDLNIAKMSGWTALSVAIILTICFWLKLYGVM